MNEQPVPRTAETDARMVAIAERECAPALKIIRESYHPSQCIENILIAAFIHGAGWACSNLMPRDES